MLQIGPWGHSVYQMGVPETGDHARILLGYSEPPPLPPPMYFHRFMDCARVPITATDPTKIVLVKKDKILRVDVPRAWVGKDITTELIFNLWVEYFPLTKNDMQYGLWSQFIIRRIGHNWNIHCSVIGMSEQCPEPDRIVGVEDGHIPPFLDTRFIRPHSSQGQKFSFEDNLLRLAQYERTFHDPEEVGPETSQVDWSFDPDAERRRRYNPY